MLCLWSCVACLPVSPMRASVCVSRSDNTDHNAVATVCDSVGHGVRLEACERGVQTQTGHPTCVAVGSISYHTAITAAAVQATELCRRRARAPARRAAVGCTFY